MAMTVFTLQLGQHHVFIMYCMIACVCIEYASCILYDSCILYASCILYDRSILYDSCILYDRIIILSILLHYLSLFINNRYYKLNYIYFLYITLYTFNYISYVSIYCIQPLTISTSSLD